MSTVSETVDAVSQQGIDASLATPGSSFRPLVYFVLNAELDHVRLSEELEAISRAGYGGVLTMPYTPLPNAVMDDAWLDAIEAMAKVARKEDLEIWLWDEWAYPSGMGGGLVTEDPRHRAKRLYMAVDLLLAPGESLECTAPPRMLAAASCPTDKYGAPVGTWRQAATNADGGITFQAGSERERCVVVCWGHFSNHACTVDGRGDVHSADMLSAAATDRFIEVIHERYARRLGEYFGDPIKGFFYDEPTQAVPFPWTEAFPEEFRKGKGRDILAELPPILSGMSTGFTDPEGGACTRVRHLADDYFDVWTDLVEENFYRRLEVWCHEHGVLSVGHQDMDHRLFNLATVSGHFFKNSLHNDHPGIDVIYNSIQPGVFEDFPRYAGSAMRVAGKTRALSESGGVKGFGMSPDHTRYVLEHQIVRGVNQFFLGFMKYDASSEDPIAVGPDLAPWTNPIMKEFGPLLNQRIQRLSALACSGHSSATTALYLPMHDIAAAQLVLSQPHTGNHGLPWEIINEMAEGLTYSFCEFDYLWDEGLLSLQLTEDGLRSPAGHLYTTIIVPPACTLKPGVADRLDAFAGSGGRILTLGPVAEGLTTAARECAGLDDLVARAPRQVTFEGPRHRIALSGRTDGERDLWIFLNEDTRPIDLTVTFPGGGCLLEVDLICGTSALLLESGTLSVPLHFEPTESRVFVRQPGCDGIPWVASASAGAPVAIRNWDLVLPDGSRHSLENRFPDWCELGFAEFSGTMYYTAEFEWPAGFECGLLHLGDVRHAATVQLDDREDVIPAPFVPFQVALSGLTPGPHSLKVRVFNTQANDHRKKQYWGRELDYRKLSSGLLGPVRLTACEGAGPPGRPGP